MKKLMVLLLVLGAAGFFPTLGQVEETLKESDIVYELSVDDLGKFNPGYSAKTQIAYSEEGVRYKKGQKKAPVADTYIRVSSIAMKKHAWGKEMVAAYVFTGVEQVAVEPVEGAVDVFPSEKYGLDHKNVKIFTKTISANKAKKAVEEAVVFKATPKSEGSLKLDVIYDETVPYLNDTSSTIEFKN